MIGAIGRNTAIFDQRQLAAGAQAPVAVLIGQRKQPLHRSVRGNIENGCVGWRGGCPATAIAQIYVQPGTRSIACAIGQRADRNPHRAFIHQRPQCFDRVPFFDHAAQTGKIGNAFGHHIA